MIWSQGRLDLFDNRSGSLQQGLAISQKEWSEGTGVLRRGADVTVTQCQPSGSRLGVVVKHNFQDRRMQLVTTGN